MLLEVTRLIVDSLVTHPHLGILLTALAGLAVGAYGIYALLQAVRTLGKRK